ncbi:hypothetical protein HDV05_008459 [Chytridiales sp. JEL 0842]|nr:hypothetical protein HDV05_008459 [Chytridiales sp. JEL 0842]
MFRLVSTPRLNSVAFRAVQRRAASTDAAKDAAANAANRLQAVAEPLIHYGKVAVEFGRLVAQHGKVSLPNPAQFAEAQRGYANFFTALQNGAWKKVTLSEVGSLVAGGVTVYGFFLAGEMIGRGSFVGYHIPGAAAGGHH